jgi:crotonobetainyl-CoA:carnitine CoA-transferase CaiB-like acyl-CoA transferase
MPDGPLAGVAVVEIASDPAAQFCARLLADYGADVIKLEPPAGDPLREQAPDWFDGLNTNKRSAVADLQTAQGRDIAAGLLARADVLVCDQDPDGLLRDCDVDAPRLIRTSITPFGCTGPRAGWLGGDLVAAAAGGLAFVTGDPEREPLVPGGHQMLHLSGLSAFTATAIALRGVHAGHPGQHVDVSLQETAALVLECAVTPWQMHGLARGRMHTLHPAVHGVGLQRLGDGHWLFVGTLPQLRMWQTVKELLGEPEWAQDERWDDPRERRRHAEEIDALAAPIFATMTAHDIYPAMKQGRVPVGLVRDMDDLRDPEGQLASRDFYTTAPGEATPDHPGAPWRMTATPWRLRSAAPSRPTPGAPPASFSQETR